MQRCLQWASAPYINSFHHHSAADGGDSCLWSAWRRKAKKAAKKIATITRYVTVGLGLIQGTAYYFYLRNSTIRTLPCTMKVSAGSIYCDHHCSHVHRRHGADHVDGRADQPEGHRQRHLHHLVCRYRRTSSGYDGSDLAATSRLQCSLRRATASTLSLHRCSSSFSSRLSGSSFL